MPERPQARPPRLAARLMLVALLALALLARLAMALMMSDGGAARLPESGEYLAIAQSLAQGKGIALTNSTTGQESLASRMPGYPVVLAAAEAVSGAPVRGALVFQAVCGAATLVLILWAAARLASVWASLVAVALLAFDPYQVYFSALVAPTVMTGLALAGVMAAGLKFLVAAESGGRRAWVWAMVAGLALAGATYLEPWAAGFLLLAGAAALVSRNRRRLLTGWAVAAAVLAVALAPWLIRNASLAGGPVLTTDLGLALYRGTEALGEGPGGLLAPDGIARETEGLDEVGRDGYCLRQAVRRIGGAPVAWLSLAAGRAARVWHPGAILAEETGPLHPLAGYTSLVPIVALAAVGLWVLRRRRSVVVWLLLAPVHVTLVGGLFEGGAADRLAVMSALSVLGGIGLAVVLGRGDERGVAPEPRA